MKRPKEKYWKVTRQEIGRELGNPDYIKYLESRLAEIAEIIERVDNRCMAVDGPVPSTLQEMTQEEISKIYKLAKGNK